MITGEISAAEELRGSQQDALMDEGFTDVLQSRLHESVRDDGFSQSIFREETPQLRCRSPSC